jgi:hypothetical protein
MVNYYIINNKNIIFIYILDGFFTSDLNNVHKLFTNEMNTFINWNIYRIYSVIDIKTSPLYEILKNNNMIK